jgi:hypothetical protein
MFNTDLTPTCESPYLVFAKEKVYYFLYLFFVVTNSYLFSKL